jgi:hypothetical protein
MARRKMKNDSFWRAYDLKIYESKSDTIASRHDNYEWKQMVGRVRFFADTTYGSTFLHVVHARALLPPSPVLLYCLFLRQNEMNGNEIN